MLKKNLSQLLSCVPVRCEARMNFMPRKWICPWLFQQRCLTTKKEREERKSLTRIKQRSEDGSSATSCHTDLSVQSWDSYVCVCECVWYHPAIKVRLSVTLSPDCFRSHCFAVWSTVRLKPNKLSLCEVQNLELYLEESVSA